MRKTGLNCPVSSADFAWFHPPRGHATSVTEKLVRATRVFYDNVHADQDLFVHAIFAWLQCILEAA
eukprot:1058245-Amphidinium_carterae.1